MQLCSIIFDVKSKAKLLNILYIFKESFIQAFSELRNNKMRTFLSLLGIMIGIFCIISIQAAVDSLESNIRSSFEKLGDDIVYVDKRPWSDEGRDFWVYANRPETSFKDYKAIVDHSKLAEIVTYSCFIGSKTLRFNKNIVEGTFLMGVSEGYADIFKIDLQRGRFFTLIDIIRDSDFTVLGSDVAENLFGQTDPIGRYIKIGGKRLQVIGVVAKTGKSLINPLNFDQVCIVSYKTAESFVNFNGENFRSSINAKAKPNVTLVDLKDELTSILRAERRLKPLAEDNFSLNELSMLDKIFDSIFKVLKLAGAIIGGFAILVGMFSVANIMFVSVKERTNIIGIKKALGAKRKVILLEFLIESVVLCVLGGVLGLIAVMGALQIATVFSDFQMNLSLYNVSMGLLLSIIVGIIAGVIPAYNAAKMDPVEAIRQG